VQPGLAQLRLAQGHTDLALAAIRGLAQDAQQIRQRASFLDSAVEILLAARDHLSARSAADELAQLAGTINAPLLHAISWRATGAVLLAEGNVEASLVILRRALETFQELGAPYDEARVRVLLSQSCKSQEDCDTADLELEAAHRIFERLGADHEITQLVSLSSSPYKDAAEPLTRREIEVLKLIASGLTNRTIASKLFISEKTVARHISNIFTKLDLSSRSAVTAYAYQNHLL
jgi:DNA-binding CsgD family transcriptional regulator